MNNRAPELIEKNIELIIPGIPIIVKEEPSTIGNETIKVEIIIQENEIGYMKGIMKPLSPLPFSYLIEVYTNYQQCLR